MSDETRIREIQDDFMVTEDTARMIVAIESGEPFDIVEVDPNTGEERPHEYRSMFAEDDA